MKTNSIKRVGLVGNATKPECASMIHRATQLIERTGRKVLVDGDVTALARQVDLLLVFGGVVAGLLPVLTDMSLRARFRRSAETLTSSAFCAARVMASGAAGVEAGAPTVTMPVPC